MTNSDPKHRTTSNDFLDLVQGRMVVIEVIEVMLVGLQAYSRGDDY